MNASEKFLTLFVMSSEDWIEFELSLNKEKVVLESNVITIQKLLNNSTGLLRILGQSDEISMLKDKVFK
jgi:hypothetical protein